MKNNTKKEAFTLLEVIISMAIVGILSVGIYNGYMIIIKQTKAGQVKQEIALEGKKVIESVQADSFEVPQNTLTIENMTFEKKSSDFVRYLNENYKDKDADRNSITEDNAKYIEKITLMPTEVKDSTETIKLVNNGSNLNINRIYISKVNSRDYISYWEYNEQSQYDPDSDNDKDEIELFTDSDSGKSKMEISIYLTEVDDDTEQIQILNYEGQELVSVEKDISEDLIINFSKYKKTDGTLPNDTDIEINMYNKTSVVSNVYIEKEQDLDVNLEVRKGEINTYNNRPEDEQDDVGTLYDIKVNITNKNNEILFTGYYKKNLK